MNQKKKLPFINIEGSDGSGKATQVNLLEINAKSAGYETSVFDYPNYPRISSTMVQLYLGGKLPGRMNSPEAASTYYAIDRNADAEEIAEARKIGKLVISNRFTPSNMAHQGTKIPNLAERKKFYNWIMDLEFIHLGIPKPSTNIVLMVDAETSLSNVEYRNRKELLLGTITRIGDDVHENPDHLSKSTEVYQELCELYPEWFTPIDCMRSDGQSMLTPEEIAADVWSTVKELL